MHHFFLGFAQKKWFHLSLLPNISKVFLYMSRPIPNWWIIIFSVRKYPHDSFLRSQILNGLSAKKMKSHPHFPEMLCYIIIHHYWLYYATACYIPKIQIFAEHPMEDVNGQWSSTGCRGLGHRACHASHRAETEGGFGPQKLGIHPMFGCQDCYRNTMIYVETGDSTSKHWTPRTPQKSDFNQDKRTAGYPQTWIPQAKHAANLPGFGGWRVVIDGRLGRSLPCAATKRPGRVCRVSWKDSIRFSDMGMGQYL